MVNPAGPVVLKAPNFPGGAPDYFVIAVGKERRIKLDEVNACGV